MNRQNSQSIYHTNVNVNLMVGNINQTKSGKTINVGASTKEHHVWQKDYIGKLSSCSCKKGKYVGGIIDGPVITYDETINVARLDVTWAMRAKSYGKATKTVPTKTTLTKMVPIKITLISFYISQLFINYHSINDSC